MVKVQKGHPVNKKKTKSIPSKTKRKSKHQQDNEEVDDVMAWGKSKQNYYQDEEDQYSEASEEQDEAKQIYDNQFNNLNEEQFYDLPEDQDQQAELSQREDEEEDVINDEYVREQIIWATGLAKLFQTVEDEKAQFRKKVYDSYLLILMTLKQFKIPYVDQHPLVSNLPILKKALQHFQSEIPKLQKKLEQECEQMPEQAIGQQQVSDQHENEQDDFNQQYDNFMDEMDEEEDNISYENSPQQTKSKSVSKHESKNVKQGLQIYEKIKTQKQQERRQKKMENKKHRLQSRPKQAFKLVNQNEARLANEKILKNKGLMKRRQKGDGNSRTKLRGKYEKALIRRRAKGIVGVKQNPGRFYAGQDKVLYGKIASTKIK